MENQLAQIAAQLGIDYTFFYLLGLVVALYVVLGATYLKPYQALLLARRQRTDGLKQRALELSNQAEEKLAQYKARLKDTYESARKVIRYEEEAAAKEEARLVADAAGKAKSVLQQAQRELDSQKKEVVEGLGAEIGAIAAEIAAKVLGRPVGGGVRQRP